MLLRILLCYLFDYYATLLLVLLLCYLFCYYFTLGYYLAIYLTSLLLRMLLCYLGCYFTTHFATLLLIFLLWKWLHGRVPSVHWMSSTTNAISFCLKVTTRASEIRPDDLPRFTTFSLTLGKTQICKTSHKHWGPEQADLWPQTSKIIRSASSARPVVIRRIFVNNFRLLGEKMA